MNHTPGPWSTSDYFVIRADGGFGPSVCTVSTGTIHGPFEDAVIKANANLLAAAPDLLASLKELIEGVDEHWMASFPGCVDRADAAIAKAEGAQ